MTLSTPVATSVRSCGALGPARAVADSSTSSSNCGTATSAPSPKGARILPDRPTTQPPDPQGLLSARYHFGSNAQPTRERHIILHAHNRDKNAHRSYRLDRIEEASVTSEPFVPRFAVELTLLVWSKRFARRRESRLDPGFQFDNRNENCPYRYAEIERARADPASGVLEGIGITP